MKCLPLLACSLLLVSCASVPRVQTDFDPAAAFASYHSYAWRQEPPVSNPLVKQRLVAAIDSGNIGEALELANQYAAMDNPFPQIDYRLFAERQGRPG